MRGKYLLCDADTTSVMYYGDTFNIWKLIPNIEPEWWLHEIWCESLILRTSSGQESFVHFVLVELRKRMNKPKKCSRDSTPSPAPVWTVSRMRIPQCEPAHASVQRSEDGETDPILPFLWISISISRSNRQYIRGYVYADEWWCAAVGLRFV